MNCRRHSSRQARQGYTLVEVMISTMISTIVIAAAFSIYSHVSRICRAGSSQVRFTSSARLVSQKIALYIEQGKAVRISSNSVDIMTIELECAQISFVDGDNDNSTVEDNVLIYDPDVLISGNEKTICTHVTPIAGEPMFSMVSSSPNAAKFVFHVGDGTDAKHASFAGTGAGYQGVEVRLTVTPRNLQHWYD